MEEPPARDWFQCSYRNCQFMTFYKSALNRHMRNMHENGNKVICPKCGKAYRKSEYLFEHLYKAHGQTRSPTKLTWRRPNGQLIERRCKRAHNVAIPQTGECLPTCSKKVAKQHNQHEHATPSTSAVADKIQATSIQDDLGHILSKEDVEKAEHQGEQLLDILEKATDELLNWDQINPTLKIEETINWEQYLK